MCLKMRKVGPFFAAVAAASFLGCWGGGNGGLVGWWKLDETSGWSAADSSGNGNVGSVVGAVWTTGKIGGALDFDGVDDYVDMGDVLNDVSVPFSLSAWVYRRGSSGMILISSDDSKSYYGFWFSLNADNTLSVAYGDGTGSTGYDRRSKNSTFSVVSDVWTHVAAVVRGPTDMSLYIDGTDAGGTPSGSGGPMVHSTDTFRVGVLREQYADCLLDEIRVYDGALSAAEIQALSAAGP